MIPKSGLKLNGEVYSPGERSEFFSIYGGSHRQVTDEHVLGDTQTLITGVTSSPRFPWPMELHIAAGTPREMAITMMQNAITMIESDFDAIMNQHLNS